MILIESKPHLAGFGVDFCCLLAGTRGRHQLRPVPFAVDILDLDLAYNSLSVANLARIHKFDPDFIIDRIE